MLFNLVCWPITYLGSELYRWHIIAKANIATTCQMSVSLGLCWMNGIRNKVDLLDGTDVSYPHAYAPEWTRRYIGPERTWCKYILSRYSDLASRYSDLLSYNSDLASRYSDLLSHYSDLASRYSDLLSHYSDLASRYSDLVIAYIW